MSVPRKYVAADRTKILDLYQRVARIVGGIARTSEEVTDGYIEDLITNAQKEGIQLVIDHPTDGERLIGEIHCYKLEPKVFGHILSELTIVVDAEFQGNGVGKSLFQALLNQVETTRPDILRVELIARESNTRAINFYEQLGFRTEGRLENRIDSRDGSFEADIPMGWMNRNFNSRKNNEAYIGGVI